MNLFFYLHIFLSSPFFKLFIYHYTIYHYIFIYLAIFLSTFSILCFKDFVKRYNNRSFKALKNIPFINQMYIINVIYSFRPKYTIYYMYSGLWSFMLIAPFYVNFTSFVVLFVFFIKKYSLKFVSFSLFYRNLWKCRWLNITLYSTYLSILCIYVLTILYTYRVVQKKVYDVI